LKKSLNNCTIPKAVLLADLDNIIGTKLMLLVDINCSYIASSTQLGYDAKFYV